MKSSDAIGVFDSGIGGLTVLKEIRGLLPNEDILYFGDTARVPYGTKSAGTVGEFASQIVDFLVRQRVKLVVVACNTVSAMALGHLRDRFKSVPLFGVVEPGVTAAVNATKNRRIGVIGTVGTVNSHAYRDRLLERDPGISVFQQACPLFVPLVETGWTGNRVAELTVSEYLVPLRKKKIDTLVLGCTHYPMLKPVIRKVMGKSVRLVDSAEEISGDVKAYLTLRGLLNGKRKKGKVRCWLSDMSPYSIKAAGFILREKNIRFALKKF